MKKIIVLGLLIFIAASAVSAQNRRPADRLRNQRIVQGYRSGELNRFELRHLRRDAQRQRLATRRAHRDGVVTRPERRRLNALKRDQRRDLFRFRHNNRRRYI
jgi:hypothetical protein